MAIINAEHILWLNAKVRHNYQADFDLAVIVSAIEMLDNQKGKASARGISKQTFIPRPTVIRKLKLLVECGFVVKLDGGGYIRANELTFQLTPPNLDELSPNGRAIERLSLLWKAQELIQAEIAKLGAEALPVFDATLNDTLKDTA